MHLEAELERLFRYEGSGHDIHHLERVRNTADTLQQAEGGDRVVIETAAYLHDVHRLIQHETGRYCSPHDSLPMVEQLLEKTSLADSAKRHVLHCVEHHEEYGFTAQGKRVSDIETLIVQDADNLDAIGALGIARTFAYGGAHKIPLWMPEVPLEQGTYDDSTLEASSIHHFYTKLLRLKEDMNTATARRMAASRHAFMEQFLDEFFGEWQGKL